MTKLVAAGDRTGDGRSDLLAVRRDGALVLYPGDGRGWVTAGQVIATGFDGMRSVTSAGDLTGDGRPALLALRSSDGRLLLYPGADDGGVASPRTWGSGWGSLDTLSSGPDLDGDGNVGDIVVRQRDGGMRTYYADSAGKLTRYNFWGAGWNALDNITSGADWDGDGAPDVIARYPKASTLRLYTGTGQRDFESPPEGAGVQVEGMDLVRVVGDVNADGYTDAIGRQPNGDLYFLKGRSGGFVTGSARIGAGWQIFDLIEAGAT
jgi:hypothetical protein